MAETLEALSARHPVIMGHRGFQARYPENTLISFQAAVEAGADAIEMDVNLTRDGVPVIIHDGTVDRTTDGQGRVDQLQFKEIRELDAGRWFSPRFAGERIPTLQEVLDGFGGKVLLNIEIKAYGKNGGAAAGDVERAVVQLVARSGAGAGVLISSFDATLLTNVRRLPHAPAVALISKYVSHGKALSACRELGVYSYHPNFRFINAALVQKMHAAGFRVYAYNANTAANVRKLAAMHADGVIAKAPHLARRWWIS